MPTRKEAPRTAAPTKPAGAPKPSGGATRKDPRILMVEDNAQDVRLMQEGFKEVGFQPKVEACRDGETAWARIRVAAGPLRPDMVLLDLNLPGMSGHELLKRIQADAGLRNLPVVILSSSNHPDDVLQARLSKAHAYFLKPFSMAGYVALARDLREFWNAGLPSANP